MTNPFKKVKNAMQLMKSIDLKQLEALAQKVDLPKMLDKFSQLDERQMKALVKMLEQSDKKKELPVINGDFYETHLQLKPEHREIKPLVNNYWLHDEFPFEIIPKFKTLNLCGVTYEGYGCPNLPFVMEGVIAAEMARVDASIATFFGAHSGLAMGSIYLLGSEEQKQKWLPKMQQFEAIGAFGLTEPEVGSAVAGGLTTTCKKTEEGWILNGQKKWIGNATFSEITIIWARDVEDNQVKGFIVENDTPGFEVEKIKGKMALRIVQNGLITMTNCLVKQ